MKKHNSLEIAKLLEAIKNLPADPLDDGVSAEKRLPLRMLKLYPKMAFRLRVLKVSQETKQPPIVVAEQMMEIAAGMDVRPVKVCPLNGPDVGVALDSVVAVLQKTQVCIRRLDSEENLSLDKVQKIHDAYASCMELLIAADKLAEQTFYNHATLVKMQAFAFKNNEVIQTLVRDLQVLEKNTPPEGNDPQKQKDKLASAKANLDAHVELATVLKRLGFAPDFE